MNSNTPSLLRDILSRPSTSASSPSSAPPSTSAPPSSTESPSTSAPPSSTSAPPPTVEEIPVIHFSDDEDVEWERVTISTAHPNYYNPELHDLVVEELFSDRLLSSPPENDESWRALIPYPVLLAPFPPSPTSSPPPSPTSSSPPATPPPSTSSPPATPSYLPAAAYCNFRPPPPTSLPVRRLQRHQLWHGMYYLIWTWETTETNNIFRIFSLNFEEIFEVFLPFNILPTRQQLLHHLFESDLYLRQTRVNGRLTITFHP